MKKRKLIESRFSNCVGKTEAEAYRDQGRVNKTVIELLLDIRDNLVPEVITYGEKIHCTCFIKGSDCPTHGKKNEDG